MNRFQGTNSAWLCSVQPGEPSRADNPIPSRFLAHINCLKIPALQSQTSQIGGWGGGGSYMYSLGMQQDVPCMSLCLRYIVTSAHINRDYLYMF
jgi:hypothetical protein